MTLTCQKNKHIRTESILATGEGRQLHERGGQGPRGLRRERPEDQRAGGADGGDGQRGQELLAHRPQAHARRQEQKVVPALMWTCDHLAREQLQA